MFLNQTLGLLTHHTVKPVYWHQVVVKASTAFTAGDKQAVCSKELNFPKAFGEGLLREGLPQRQYFRGGLQGAWPFFWLVGSEITDWCFWNLNHPIWGLHACVQQVVTTLHLGRGMCLSSCKNSKIYVRLLWVSLEEKPGLCFIAELLSLWASQVAQW